MGSESISPLFTACSLRRVEGLKPRRLGVNNTSSKGGVSIVRSGSGSWKESETKLRFLKWLQIKIMGKILVRFHFNMNNTLMIDYRLKMIKCDTPKPLNLVTLIYLFVFKQLITQGFLFRAVFFEAIFFRTVLVIAVQHTHPIHSNESCCRRQTLQLCFWNETF